MISVARAPVANHGRDHAAADVLTRPGCRTRARPGPGDGRSESRARRCRTLLRKPPHWSSPASPSAVDEGLELSHDLRFAGQRRTQPAHDFEQQRSTRLRPRADRRRRAVEVVVSVEEADFAQAGTPDDSVATAATGSRRAMQKVQAHAPHLTKRPAASVTVLSGQTWRAGARFSRLKRAADGHAGRIGSSCFSSARQTRRRRSALRRYLANSSRIAASSISTRRCGCPSCTGACCEHVLRRPRSCTRKSGRPKDHRWR